MSRNVRQKYPPARAPVRAPVRAPKRRDYDSSSIDLSDESGYSGVEDVTDSEDDDEDHVFAAEEEHIISVSRKRSLVPPRPLIEEDDDADESEADEEEEEAEAEAEEDPADDSASWDGIVSDHDEFVPADSLATDLLDRIAAIPVERHVRFEGVPDSDSDDTTSETSEINDFFPDIFVEQSALDPSFRREIEDDDETSSNGSFWDFHSGSQELKAQAQAFDGEGAQYFDTTPLATPRASQPPTELLTPVVIPAEVQELDGYESEFASSEGAQLVLILRQLMVIPPRKTSRSPSSVKSRPGGLTQSTLRTRTRRRPSRASPASLALAGSTSTGPTTSPSASSTPRPAR
jgi:hypothetical protein